jgi:DNA-binding MarR family transcriptional regulator
MAFALTVPRLQIYQYIVEYKRTHNGNSPSVRELSVSFNLSTSVIHDHLARLEAIGLIERGAKGESRMINVVGSKWVLPKVREFSDADVRRLLKKVLKG